MSNLNRLRELAALLQPKRVNEARVKTRADLEKKFSSIQETAKDLADDLSEGGALETMMDDVGVTSHEKVSKDAAAILKTLAAAVRTIEMSLMEAEGLLFSAMTEARDPEPVMEVNKNHMDENTYQSVASWKRALKAKYGMGVRYVAHEGTIDAFAGEKDDIKKERQVGDWDDTTGTVY